MSRLLVSACLLGNPVRYDGQAKTIGHAGLEALVAAGRVIAFCPEVSGGLPTPRPAAEIVGGDGVAVLNATASVRTADGIDVSRHFVVGAENALAQCLEHEIRVAILTEKSPSCGSSRIYDGSHQRKTITGAGVTAALLQRHGIDVFSQHQIDAALRRLESCSSTAARR